MAAPRSPRRGGLRTASSSSLRNSHRRHATPERGRRPRRSRRQLPDATSPSILAPSRHADASDPTKRGGHRRPIRLKVRVAHLWHARVRNAGQQGQPVSRNQAPNGGSRVFPAGFSRSHNPSVQGSSPCCPTTRSLLTDNGFRSCHPTPDRHDLPVSPQRVRLPVLAPSASIDSKGRWGQWQLCPSEIWTIR
jgi:hypothetical protein